MTIQEILGMCDHTLLKQESTWEQIKGICDDAMKYHTASICIPPCYVRQAAEYMRAEEESGRGKSVPVCTVIGFPNGNHTTMAKVFETICSKNEAKAIDASKYKTDDDLDAFFKDILPNFDEERVYKSDIKKMIAWYNLLIGAGITDFSIKDSNEQKSEETEDSNS